MKKRKRMEEMVEEREEERTLWQCGSPIGRSLAVFGTPEKATATVKAKGRTIHTTRLALLRPRWMQAHALVDGVIHSASSPEPRETITKPSRDR